MDLCFDSIASDLEALGMVDCTISQRDSLTRSPSREGLKKRYKPRIINTKNAQNIYVDDASFLFAKRRKHMKYRPTTDKHFDNIREWERLMQIIVQNGHENLYLQELKARGIEEPVVYNYVHPDPEINKKIKAKRSEQLRLDTLDYAQNRLAVARMFTA